MDGFREKVTENPRLSPGNLVLSFTVSVEPIPKQKTPFEHVRNGQLKVLPEMTLSDSKTVIN